MTYFAGIENGRVKKIPVFHSCHTQFRGHQTTILYTYYPGCPARHGPNGDPGDPPEDPEVEIQKILSLGIELDLNIITPEEWEKLDQECGEHFDRTEGEKIRKMDDAFFEDYKAEQLMAKEFENEAEQLMAKEFENEAEQLMAKEFENE